MILRYFWPTIVWSTFILIVTLIPGEAVPDVDIFEIDKLVHFFLFGTVMILTAYALVNYQHKRGLPSKPLLWAGIYSVVFGMLIEFLQLFVPGRSFSLADMVANTIGVGIGYVIFKFLYNKFLKRSMN